MKQLVPLLLLICSLASAVDVPKIPDKLMQNSYIIRSTDIFGEGRGTGWCVDLSDYGINDKCYLITAAHVVLPLGDRGKPAMLIEVRVPGKDGWVWSMVEVVGIDKKYDIALLKSTHQFPYAAKIAKKDEFNVGDGCILIGCAAGHAPAASIGYLSDKGAIDEDVKPWWTVAIVGFFGCSGGAIYDAKSEQVIGFCDVVFGAHTPSPYTAGMMPFEYINKFLEKIKEDNWKIVDEMYKLPVP